MPKHSIVATAYPGIMAHGGLNPFLAASKLHPLSDNRMLRIIA